MIKNSSFNLEKIQEITSPIEEFEGKIKSLKEIFERSIKTKIKITKKFQDSTLLYKIQVISQSFNDLYTNLIEFSNENVKKFLIFQSNLTEKYNKSFKQNLNGLNLKTKEIGLNLIEDKKIFKVLKHSTIIPSLSSNQWIELIKSLQENSLFVAIIKNVEKFLEAEEFRITKKKIKEQQDAEVLKELEEKQSKLKLNEYQEYLKYSKAEFDKRRRREKRKKLEDLQAKPETLIEITGDISEKIENYKSKLKSEFNEKYLIQKDEGQDPITLIRELKKEEEEKYKEYLKKIRDKK